MKVQIDVVDKVVAGDMLIFDGKHFVAINKDKLLRDVNNNIMKLEDRIVNLGEKVIKLENTIKDLEREIRILKGEE